MSHNLPLYTSANGINRLALLVLNPDRGPERPWKHIRKDVNSWEFTVLASAINIGMEILEKPMGRSTLERLGRLVVEGWHSGRRHQFGGNIRSMSAYVDHFLSALRADFPNVIIDDLELPDCLAYTERIPAWNGDLANFQPKMAVAISFNHSVSPLPTGFDY